MYPTSMILSEFLQKSPNCEWAHSSMNSRNGQAIFCRSVEQDLLRKDTIKYIFVYTA
jgi:hypothetical protein